MLSASSERRHQLREQVCTSAPMEQFLHLQSAFDRGWWSFLTKHNNANWRYYRGFKIDLGGKKNQLQDAYMQYRGIVLAPLLDFFRCSFQGSSTLAPPSKAQTMLDCISGIWRVAGRCYIASSPPALILKTCALHAVTGGLRRGPLHFSWSLLAAAQLAERDKGLRLRWVTWKPVAQLPDFTPPSHKCKAD